MIPFLLAYSHTFLVTIWSLDGFLLDKYRLRFLLVKLLYVTLVIKNNKSIYNVISYFLAKIKISFDTIFGSKYSNGKGNRE